MYNKNSYRLDTIVFRKQKCLVLNLFCLEFHRDLCWDLYCCLSTYIYVTEFDAQTTYQYFNKIFFVEKVDKYSRSVCIHKKIK